jgi:hypothetical protein
MGPTIIFDKSMLQSLNEDEAMWLDNFFLSNITPLFYIETLADLEKEVRAGRLPEEVVGSLASKTPDASSKCNVYHMSLLSAELSGAGEIEMSHGRPIISGGKTMELGGKTGIIFQQSPEEEAFQRWQRREFLQLERSQAKAWRNGLSNINLEANYQLFQVFFPMGKPKTLLDVKRFVDFHIDGPDQEETLAFGLSLLGVPERSRQTVLSRWRTSGKPHIKQFAPYFTHVFSVDLFFNFAIAADLIGRGRPSHKIDLAYLYYLPFCSVFTSNDKLHASIAPFFLRENQTYIPGVQLKADLAKIDAYFDAFPDDVKNRGVISFAFYPPTEGEFLVSQLWDKHMSPKWRDHKVQPKPQPDSELSKKIVEEIEHFEERASSVPEERRVDSDEADHVVIKRTVRVQKGKWKRFPPEVINRRKNERGEWEDIRPEDGNKN